MFSFISVQLQPTMMEMVKKPGGNQLKGKEKMFWSHGDKF
jgi:hypothetical protein